LAGEASRPQDKKTIESKVKAFVSAWNQGDADAFVNLFSPDGTMKSPSQKVVQSRESIRALLTRERAELFQDSTLKKNIRTITFQGPDQSTVEGTYELSGVEPGVGVVEVSINGEFTFHLEKQGDTWYITTCDIRESGKEL